MNRIMNPIEVSKSLREAYLRYLETSFYLKDPSLRRQFSALLEDKSQPPLVREPILEVTPGFETSGSISGLIDGGVMAHDFNKLDKDILHRPLYAHQEIALRKAIVDRRNLIIATGTGSGKTECFLFPIIHELLMESKKGSLNEQGVRSLLLYPMNALANDQIARLRDWAKLFPEITFGRYTGETKQDYESAENAYLAFHGEDPLQNELISRAQMQETPPHILFTNYAMLEYLLIRPKDSPLFEGGRWRFIVLDEVHTYSGALGVEIAMLIRRLKERVVGSEKRRLQCIGTSATLGAGEKDFLKIARFAENLFDEKFDTTDIIGPEIRALKDNFPTWGKGSQKLYQQIKKILFQDNQYDLTRLETLFLEHASGVKQLDLEKFVKLANKQDGQKAQCQAFLYAILSGDSQVQELRNRLKQDRALELTKMLNINGLIDLVALGAFARQGNDPVPLIPARYHIMARAIGGVFGWIDNQGSCQLLAQRKRQHSGHAVSEIGSCNRCGEVMLVGEKKSENGQDYLRQPPGVGDDPIVKLSWYVFDEKRNLEIDEDDIIEEGKEKNIINIKSTRISPMLLCRVCGRIGDESTFDEQCIGHDANIVKIYEIENKKRRSVPRQCPSCLNHYGSVASRVLTGREAPVAVLATSLYQKIPSSQEPNEAKFPGAGRKLMMFSDSRQDAAFFAPFMDNTYNKLKQRRYLVQALGDSRKPLELEDWAREARQKAENAVEWDEDAGSGKRKRNSESWALREWTAIDRRMGLEGTGTIIFRLRKPENFSLLPFLSNDPWRLDAGEQWILIQTLLDTLRHQGIVSFGDFTPQHDDEVFKPRNFASFIRISQSLPQKHIYAWEPSQRHTNKRLNYLMRLLKDRVLKEEDIRNEALKILKKFWECINHLNGPLAGLFEKGLSYKNESNLLRLKPQRWEVVAVRHDEDNKIYRCTTCGLVTAFAVRQVCPMTGCPGKVIPYSIEDKRKNHFFRLFNEMAPIPLEVREHTAQLTKDQAAITQQDFICGKVNMLSCTTTFELGVDVGDLQTVFLRNMPPNPGNYVQRAGRAGRRADNAAIIVSYAQRRTHDFAYFDHWQKMVKGAIRPPAIRVENAKIVRRHIHAEALAVFYKENRDLFADRIEMLFDPENSCSDDLMEFLYSHPEGLQIRLKRIVPEPIWGEIGIDDWAWLSGKGMNEDAKRECFKERLQHAKDDIYADWKALDEAKKEASEREDYWNANIFKKQLKTLKNRSLLGKLGTYGLMPKYGFPTEVVEMKIRSSSEEAQQIELDRDMKLALSEFAPGNQVVANKNVWTSRGIVLPTGDRKLHQFRYWWCEKCQYFLAERVVSTTNVESEEPESKTCHCKKIVEAKHYLYPEFGFTTESTKGKRVGDARPPFKTYSSIFYHEDENGGDFNQLASMPQISFRENNHGWIHVINDNRNKGFWVCMSCGYTFSQYPYGGKTPDTTHQRPWQGKGFDKCNGMLEKIAIGYRYRTDVLEIKMPDTVSTKNYLKNNEQKKSLWLSILYALVNGACRSLDINERDLGGCLYYSKGVDPLIVLFDTAPGGAGFVKDVKNNFVDVVKNTKKLLNCQYCAEDSSCVSCLRTYFNQRDHNFLQRGLALKFIESINI